MDNNTKINNLNDIIGNMYTDTDLHADEISILQEKITTLQNNIDSILNNLSSIGSITDNVDEIVSLTS